jgi:hypothetical protein
MTSDTAKIDCAQLADEGLSLRFDNWFDPIESAIRARVRGFIEELIENELEAVLARLRYARRSEDVDDGAGVPGHRHGQRQRTLTGPRRHGGAGAARPQGDRDLAAGRAQRAPPMGRR